MNLTEVCQRASERMIEEAGAEEERIMAGLPAARFCSDGCLRSFAGDLRYGLVAGLPDADGWCAYCGDADRTEVA